MKEKAVKGILTELEKRSKSAKRKCLIPNCQETAIKSHLLQENGILSLLAENAEIYFINRETFRQGSFGFKPKSIGEVFVFPGFCKNHDNDIFSFIEKGKIDFKQYRTHLLLSYRALASEMVKNKQMIEFDNRILNSSALKYELSDEYFSILTYNKAQKELCIKDESYYEQYFIKDIQDDNSRSFSFITIELPKIEVCASAVFTYETTREIKALYEAAGSYNINPLTEIYFHLLPCNDSSILILGCLTEKKGKCWSFIENFNLDEPTSVLNKISDLLLIQVENWLCSPSFYKKHLIRNEYKILDIYRTANYLIDERIELDFNLFDVVK